MKILESTKYQVVEALIEAVKGVMDIIGRILVIRLVPRILEIVAEGYSMDFF